MEVGWGGWGGGGGKGGWWTGEEQHGALCIPVLAHRSTPHHSTTTVPTTTPARHPRRTGEVLEEEVVDLGGAAAHRVVKVDTRHLAVAL